MRALVTGSSGFVGRHLVAALRASSVDVVEFDRNDGDLSDPATARSVIERVAPDVVFHLAAQSSARRSFDDPVATFSSNVLGTVAILDAVHRLAPRARVLVASSSEVYGIVHEADLPVVETVPSRPTSPYAASKVAQEIVAEQYARAFGLDVVISRCFNAVGPGQASQFALPSFARQLTEIARGKREPALRVGNLDVSRDFVDVRDVAHALALMAERGERGSIYNVCSGRAVRLREALGMLLTASGVDVRVEVDESRLRPADVPLLVGSYAHLNEATGWRPELPLERSLADLYQYELGRLD